jgi:glycosyltransferase involved in cell wall biosynthesis
MKAHILFVDHDVGRSGSTVSMEYLIKAFMAAGAQVSVLTPKAEADQRSLRATGAMPLSSRSWGMNTLALDLHFTSPPFPLSVKGVVAAMKNIAKAVLGVLVVSRAIRKVDADLLYVNEHVMPQASVAARFCRISAVMHVRSSLVHGRWGIRQRLAEWCICRCNDAVFAISNTEARQFNTTSCASARLVVVREFVEPSNTRPISGSPLTLPKGALVVSMLGGILTIKGTLVFLRAAMRIIERRKDVFFVVAGPVYTDENGPEAEHYHSCNKILEHMKAEGCGMSLGNINDTRALIDASDIVVSPSTVSHFSRPVIEAWACGTAVVAGRTVHMEEFIEDGRDGLLVPPGDDLELARSLEMLLNDPSMRQRLGSAGREKCRQLFDAATNTGIIVNKCLSLLTP